MINSKFAPLASYLKIQDSEACVLTFLQIEEILGFQLCYSARRYRVYWSKSPTHMLPLVCDEAGYKIKTVDMKRETAQFIKHKNI